MDAHALNGHALQVVIQFGQLEILKYFIEECNIVGYADSSFHLASDPRVVKYLAERKMAT